MLNFVERCSAKKNRIGKTTPKYDVLTILPFIMAPVLSEAHLLCQGFRAKPNSPILNLAKGEVCHERFFKNGLLLEASACEEVMTA